MRKFLSAIIFSQLCFSTAFTQKLDPMTSQAKKILERVSSTKVPADHALLAPMIIKLNSGDREGAAEIAMTHPNFLNTTVKLMALQMSTREETFRQDLNDFAASFIGVARDQRDARELLQGNFYYRADIAKVPAGVTVRVDMVRDLLQSNNHYRDLENPAVDIGTVLMRVEGQSLLDGTDAVVPNPDPAGVLTSRTFMGAHAVDGTNRRPVEFTFREFLCVPIENWADTKASDIRIGRDIDRFPGGDHAKFLTTCKGCHTQMDSFRGAFAKWDFQGNRIINSGVANRTGGFDGSGISNKLNKNGSVFSSGFITKDDSFINNSRMPANEELFSWRGPVNGNGVKNFGVMIANSKRFSQCMVKRVYDAVCRTQLSVKDNMHFIRQYAEKFEQGGYKLKQLFKEVAVTEQCLGQ